MRNLTLGSAIAGLFIALMSGCTSSPTIMRGQSPEAYRPAPRYAPRGPIQRVDYNQQQYNQPQAYGQGMDYSQNGGSCPPSGGYSGVPNCQPCQHYRFRYQVPQGLSYPDPNAMPGVIQYPYYTVKGPDDFFHQ